jgi:uncharacterized protein (DUF4415 family)
MDIFWDFMQFEWDETKNLANIRIISARRGLIVMSENDLNNTSRTNWVALAAMSDADIDYSDIPPLTDEFFQRATLRIPSRETKNLVRLDPDVKQWFEAQGEQHQALINQVLRSHIAMVSEQQ